MKALPGEVCIPVKHVTTKKSNNGTKYDLNPSWIKDKKSREITKNLRSLNTKDSSKRKGSDRTAFILYRLAKHHEKENRKQIAASVYKKTIEVLSTGKSDPKFKALVEADYKSLQKTLKSK